MPMHSVQVPRELCPVVFEPHVLQCDGQLSQLLMEGKLPCLQYFPSGQVLVVIEHVASAAPRSAHTVPKNVSACRTRVPTIFS